MRRKTRNRTGLSRLPGTDVHDAWIGFSCVKCAKLVTAPVGKQLIPPEAAFEDYAWKCKSCGFVHSRKSDLPRWANWPKAATRAKSLAAQRFWLGFFRIHAELPESYWKRCNVCGRVQPFRAFSRHAAWGPLELQMECRSCKGAINAILNPRRTKEQLHEAGARRRVADLMLKGENQRISHRELFERFKSRCFKSGKRLDVSKRSTWAIDHVLPSLYLYPLTIDNACLLSSDVNANKRAQWPSEFYTNSELVRLAKITGADLSLLSGRPVVNMNIDVDACVSRVLKVRERSNLKKRIVELKELLSRYNLVKQLSTANRKLLGL